MSWMAGWGRGSFPTHRKERDGWGTGDVCDWARAALLVGVVLPAFCGCAWGQGAGETLAGRVEAVLNREANGHSPTAEEISGADVPMKPLPDARAVQAAAPGLVKALGSPDAAVRGWALQVVSGLEQPAQKALGNDAAKAGFKAPEPGTTPAAGEAAGVDDEKTVVPPGGPGAFSAGVAKALGPVVPVMAARLLDEKDENRVLAAADFHGFAGSGLPEVYKALTAYPQRDDAVGVVGVSVVDDLLALGPVSNETAAVVARYLRRPDQSADGRATLIDTISGETNQNQMLNQVLLIYLDSDDAGIRSRLILSLPLLDLPDNVFTDLKGRLQTIAGNQGEPLPVRTAASNVVGCWTKVKMTSGCPAY